MIFSWMYKFVTITDLKYRVIFNYSISMTE